MRHSEPVRVPKLHLFAELGQKSALAAAWIASYCHKGAFARLLAESLHAVQVRPAPHKEPGAAGREDVVEISLHFQPVPLFNLLMSELVLDALPQYIPNMFAHALKVIVFKPSQPLGLYLLLESVQAVFHGLVRLKEIFLVAARKLVGQTL